MKTIPSQIKSLNAFRFFFACWIMLNHMANTKVLKPAFGMTADFFATNATFFLNYFLLLSGFGLMLSDMKKNPDNSEKVTPISSMKFAFRHVKKIYPLYFFAVTMIFILSVAEIFLEGGNFMKPLAAKIFQYVCNISMLQTVVCLDRVLFAFNLAGWFLSALMIIYFFCPAAMKIMRKAINSIPAAVFALAVCVAASYFVEKGLIALTSGIGDVYVKGCYLGRATAINYFSPAARIFYVIAGMISAQIFVMLCEKGMPLKFPTLAETVMVVLAVGFHAFQFFVGFGPFLSQYSIVFTAAFILVFAFGSGNVSALLGKEKLQKLKGLSMNIYILHYMFLEIMRFADFRQESKFISFCLSLLVVICTWMSSEIALKLQSAERKSK